MMNFEECTYRTKSKKCLLTCLDNDRHGRLLNDGAYSRKRSEAAVVPPAVLVHRVREVKVSV